MVQQCMKGTCVMTSQQIRVSWHLPEETEKKHEKSQSGQLVYWLRFETESLQIHIQECYHYNNVLNLCSYYSVFQKLWNSTECVSIINNNPALYSASLEFDSRPTDWLSWERLSEVFIIYCRSKMKYGIGVNMPWPLYFKLLILKHCTLWCSITAIQLKYSSHELY